MQSQTIFCFVLALISTVFAATTVDDNGFFVKQQITHDLMSDSRKLIEELANNLKNAGSDAMKAVGSFADGIRVEVNHVREKIDKDVENLRNKLKEAVDNVWERITNASTGVQGCIDSGRAEASNTFNQTANQALDCVDGRVADINEQIKDLSESATNAMEYGNKTMSDMQECNDGNQNLFAVGACLGRIILDVESKFLSFSAQTAAKMGRISLSMGTLPAAIEVCAGTSIVQAGITTGKIIMQIGGCATSNMYSGIIGGTSNN